jgi:dipeptidyl aminopeptidase/acylaminoacyl peptidase
MRFVRTRLLPALLAFHVLAAAGLSATDQQLSVKGVKIHFIEEGKGEPAVLIHGLQANAVVNWQLTGVVAALAKDYRVIALDLPGHGQSDTPATEQGYGLQMVEDVLKLLDHLKVKKAHVVGYSLGGMIALKFVGLHQDRVLSAVIGGMGWLREGSGAQKVWELVPAAKDVHPLGACVRSMATLALTEKEVAAIQVPVALIIGDHDPVKWLCVRPLVDVRKDWPVIDIKDAGHVSCIFKSQFRDEIKQWLDKHAER